MANTLFLPNTANGNQLKCTYKSYNHDNKLTKTYNISEANYSIAGSNTSQRRKRNSTFDLPNAKSRISE